MHSSMIAFSLGVFLDGFIPSLPNLNYLALLFIPLILSFRFPQCRLLAAYCLGLFWVLIWAVKSSELLLPTELERKDFWVRGSIDSMPEVNGINTQFIFKVKKKLPDTNRKLRIF